MRDISYRARHLRRTLMTAAALQAMALPALAGNYDWTGGSFVSGVTAPNPLAAGDVLNLLAGGSSKLLNTGLTNNGAINAFDDLYFQNGSTLSNAGTYTLQGDFGLFSGSGNGNFDNSGVLRKSAGSGTSMIGTFFTNSGRIDVQTGTLAFRGDGSTFKAGTAFTGSGQVLVAGNANFNGGFTSANLTLASGTFTGAGAVINGAVVWSGGTLQGDWQVAAGQTLKLQPSMVASKLLNGTLTNNGTLVASDNLYLRNGNALNNSALYDMQNDSGLNGASGSGNFINSGSFRKSSGTGTSYVADVSFTNNGGTIDAQTGTINFHSGAASFNAGTVFKGAGQVVISSNANFNGSFTSNNLTLTSGAFTGAGAVINGAVVWSGGALQGDWQVAAGQTLKLQPSMVAFKLLNGTLTNNGTLVASDNLYLANGNALNNSALYDMQNDSGLNGASGSGNFINSGSFRKSSGTGTSYVADVSFTNNGGTIDAQTGTINFHSGAAVFKAGTVFKGAGQVVVSSNANFNGSFTSANLTLAAGNFTGTGAVIDGVVAWSGGRLQGDWQVATGQTLNVQPDGGHALNGALTNAGTINATADIALENGSTFANNGRFNVAADVSFVEGSGNGSVINNGLLIKTGGTGTSDVSHINFINNGVVDVAVGTIRLPANFVNAGTLKGVGTFAVNNLLTNSGHVAPGESVGVLNIAGNYAQTAAGSFDVELGGAAGADLLQITGSAALDGKLALSCFASCHYAVGDTITILDSTGDLSGSFASMSLSGFATGAFTVEYDTADDRVLLHVTEEVTAAVPEPGTWALMVGGLLALGSLARRRPLARPSATG